MEPIVRIDVLIIILEYLDAVVHRLGHGHAVQRDLESRDGDEILVLLVQNRARPSVFHGDRLLPRRALFVDVDILDRLALVSDFD